MAFTATRRYRPTEVKMGAEELHDLQLLHGQKTLSTGFSSRMQRLLREKQSNAFPYITLYDYRY